MKKSLDDIIRICEEYDEIRKASLNKFCLPHEYIEMCHALKAFGLEWGDRIITLSDFRLTKGKYYISNSTTYYKPDKDEYCVHWDNGNIGRYQFTDEAGYKYIGEEWQKFIDILMSYSPVDYDKTRCHIVYDVENGKRVMADYKDICDAIKIKVRLRLQIEELEEAKRKCKELEELLKKEE